MTRTRLREERGGLVTKLEIYTPTGTFEGYVIANTDEAGALREVFLKGFGAEGSTLDGWVQVVAVLFSMALQHEAELSAILRKLAHMRFEPYGPTNDPAIPYCLSVPDYVARWLALHFGTDELHRNLAEIHERLRTAA